MGIAREPTGCLHVEEPLGGNRHLPDLTGLQIDCFGNQFVLAPPFESNPRTPRRNPYLEDAITVKEWELAPRRAKDDRLLAHRRDVRKGFGMTKKAIGTFDANPPRPRLFPIGVE